MLSVINIAIGVVGAVALVGLLSHNNRQNNQQCLPYSNGSEYGYTQAPYYRTREVYRHCDPNDPMPFKYNKPRAAYEYDMPNPQLSYNPPQGAAYCAAPVHNTPFTYAKPVQEAQPAQRPAYNPGYAWGRYAYVNAIASMPTTSIGFSHENYGKPVFRSSASDGYVWGTNNGGASQYKTPAFSYQSNRGRPMLEWEPVRCPW